MSDASKTDATGADAASTAAAGTGVVDPFALASRIKTRGPAPVHLWNPPFCGDIDMRILRDGTWLHEGKPIRRKPLVQLFASILMRGETGEYFLVTPAEKVRIQVEDCPFVVILLEHTGQGEQQQIRFITNTDERFVLDADHRLQVDTNPETDEPHPVVQVRGGLTALLSRNVFYQLVEMAVPRALETGTCFGVWSAGQFFPLDECFPRDQS